MARTSSSPRKTTPAKKTAAKPATAKRAARTPRKAASKKTAPRLSLVKTDTGRSEDAVRRTDFITDPQIYATHAARRAGLPVHRIRDWRDHRNNTATRPLRDGSLLHYDHTTRTLTWQAICPMGATYEYVIDRPSTATAARVHADRCTQPHADLSNIPALTPDELAELGLLKSPTWARPDLDITATIPVPLAGQRDRALGDTLTHSDTGADKTQPLSLGDIADGLAERAADNETPKEHPAP